MPSQCTLLFPILPIILSFCRGLYCVPLKVGKTRSGESEWWNLNSIRNRPANSSTIRRPLPTFFSFLYFFYLVLQSGKSANEISRQKLFKHYSLMPSVFPCFLLPPLYYWYILKWINATFISKRRPANFHFVILNNKEGGISWFKMKTRCITVKSFRIWQNLLEGESFKDEQDAFLFKSSWGVQ